MSIILPRRSLNIDFTRDGQASGALYPTEASKLDKILTFARASIATRVNKTGTRETVASGQPRFDYDPTTLLPRGLLIEEARTNLLLRSGDLTVSPWGSNVLGTGTTPVLSSGFSGPEGQPAFRLQANRGAGTTSGDYSGWNQPVTGLANPHSAAFSVWMKSNTGATQLVQIYTSQGHATKLCTVTVEWQRFDVVSSNAPVSVAQGLIWTRGSVASTPSIDILVSMPQLEIGTYPTSYIPTTTDAVFRAGDDVSIAGANLAPWYNPSTGTWLVDWNTFTPPGVAASMVLGAYYDSSNWMRFGRNSDGNIYWNVRTGGVNVAETSAVDAYSYGKRAVAAMSYLVNAISFAANGGTVTTDSSAALPPTPANIWLGTLNGSSNRLSGHLRRVSYLPHKVSDLLLKHMTNP